MNRPMMLLLSIALVAVSALGAASETPLTISEVRSLATQFNRQYLSAMEEVRKAESEIATARAGAFPEISLSGFYNRNLKLPSFFVNVEGEDQAVEFKTGFKNAFGASVNIRQSLWKGGKVFTAVKLAGLYGRQARSIADQVTAEVLLNADILFYSAILKQSQLDVLKAAFETNSYNLGVVEKLYSQGMVSEYEVLRAKVEKSNLRPAILRAESDLRLSRKQLKSFIGIDLDEPIVLIESDQDTSLAGLPPLAGLTEVALADRPEIKQTEFGVRMAKKVIKIARGDYFPALEAVSDYTWQSQSDRLTLDDNKTKSWSVGLSVSWPIFEGGRTRSEVSQRRAEYRQTKLVANQVRDDVKLEVEAAYDRILRAKKAFDIQAETIAQAEEGLKIARLRYETGVGTQLEVLSAQTALTRAREERAFAKFDFRQSLAYLTKATTVDIEAKN